MFQVLKKLWELKMITPLGWWRFVFALLGSGINLMALLRFASWTYPKTLALVTEETSITYHELHQQCQQLAAGLQHREGIAPGQKVGVLCRNHADLIRLLFALSPIGADLYLLNVEMSPAQLRSLLERRPFQWMIFDAEVETLLDQAGFAGEKREVSSLVNGHLNPTPASIRFQKHRAGQLVVLTGGTSGNFKTAARKPSVTDFLSPFFALVTRLNLNHYPSVYVATPVYHGFGVAAVLMSMIMGVEVHLTRRFQVEAACQLIHKHQIKVVTVVPLMIKRMMDQDAESLSSLACILCGGAKLDPDLVEESTAQLGPKLANLYGTSEAGFSIMATPEDLAVAANMLGKPLPGLKLKILNDQDEELPTGRIGRMCIKSSWTMVNKSEDWVETGDLGYVDANGYVFMAGRVDDMIVSGGENVYPVELENVLITHPEVDQAVVIGVEDAEFGQRLKAYVVLETVSQANETTLQSWLSGKVARYHRPREIVLLEEIPHTAVGKPDKKALALL